MLDVLIIGGGPAGISASLYAARAGLKTGIIAKGIGALAKAEKIENYYGFSEPVSGTDLNAAGEIQARRLGVSFHTEEVVDISWNGDFTVKTDRGSYETKTVILATGTQRMTPKIKGIQEFEGAGVSYCAVCDAFFYRNRNVAVLGAGEYAYNEIKELLPVASSVTLLTNGQKLSRNLPKQVSVNDKEVAEISGNGKVEQITFKDNSVLHAEGIFIAYGIAGSGDLARKLGAETNGKRIVVNSEMQTSIPGLFAAGDCTGGLLQVAKAVYEGALAGTAAIKFVRGEK